MKKWGFTQQEFAEVAALTIRILDGDVQCRHVNEGVTVTNRSRDFLLPVCSDIMSGSDIMSEKNKKIQSKMAEFV